jgi:hypothetical protein
MIETPVYPEIDRAFSFYGFELDDLAVLVLVFWFVETVIGQARVHVGRVDLTLYLTLLATGFLFALWRGIKIGQPRHLLKDALNLLAEPECWDVTPIAGIRPAYIIERGGRWTIETPQTGPLDETAETAPWR